MKHSYIFFLITLIIPLQAFCGSDGKKQWAKEYERLVKEKEEKIASAQREISILRPFPSLAIGEKDLPAVKRVVELIDQCIRIRSSFIVAAIQIGDNTFQGKIVSKIHAERSLMESEIATNKSYKLTIARLDLGIAQRWIDESMSKIRNAQELYSEAIQEDPDDLERLNPVIQTVLQLYLEAENGYRSAIDLCRRYISPDNLETLEKNLSDISESIEKLKQP